MDMQKAIPLDEHVTIGIYHLATSAEGTSVANIFGVGRLTVKFGFREFCIIIVRRLELHY